jgi:hypothetical protein
LAARRTGHPVIAECWPHRVPRSAHRARSDTAGLRVGGLGSVASDPLGGLQGVAGERE